MSGQSRNPLPPGGPIAGKGHGLKTEENPGSLPTMFDRENGVTY
jgi:hypothetical protein